MGNLSHFVFLREVRHICWVTEMTWGGGHAFCFKKAWLEIFQIYNVKRMKPTKIKDNSFFFLGGGCPGLSM